MRICCMRFWLLMWFKLTHQDPRMRKQAREHKALHRGKSSWKCKDCGSTAENLQSDHILPLSRFEKLGLQMHNRCLRCPPCNLKKGAKLYPDPKTLQLLLSSGFIRALKRLLWVILPTFALYWILVFYRPV